MPSSTSLHHPLMPSMSLAPAHSQTPSIGTMYNHRYPQSEIMGRNLYHPMYPPPPPPLPGPVPPNFGHLPMPPLPPHPPHPDPHPTIHIQAGMWPTATIRYLQPTSSFIHSIRTSTFFRSFSRLNFSDSHEKRKPG